MNSNTSQKLYEEYKHALYQCNEAIEALKRNYADESTIKKAERARSINESLANLWGRIYKYGLPDNKEDRGYDTQGYSDLY